MKAASAHPRNRLRLTVADTQATGRGEASDVSGTHTIQVAGRAGAGLPLANIVPTLHTGAPVGVEALLGRLEQEQQALRLERDQLRASLASALAEIARLEATVQDRAAPCAVESALVETPTPELGTLSRVQIWACARGGESTQHLELEVLEDTCLFTGLEQDIARGGVFVATYAGLAVGTQVRLALELSGGSVVLARGEVSFTRDERGRQWPGLGVSFTELSAEGVRELVDACRAAPPRYYEV